MSCWRASEFTQSTSYRVQGTDSILESELLAKGDEIGIRDENWLRGGILRDRFGFSFTDASSGLRLILERASEGLLQLLVLRRCDFLLLSLLGRLLARRLALAR